MKEGVVSPAGSSWSYGCYAVAETCSPGQNDCADHPTEPGGHGIEPSPESPATPPFPWNATFLKACQTHHTPSPHITFEGFLPVNALDPPAQILTNVHRKHVIIQLVHLLQVLTVQHLELAPLRHLLVKWGGFGVIMNSGILFLSIWILEYIGYFRLSPS